MSIVYEGKQPYIFISYAHKDNAAVPRPFGMAAFFCGYWFPVAGKSALHPRASSYDCASASTVASAPRGPTN